MMRDVKNFLGAVQDFHTACSLATILPSVSRYWLAELASRSTLWGSERAAKTSCLLDVVRVAHEHE